MKREHLTELLYQGLETEMGGTRVYETALRCVQNEELKEEWEEYLEQTKTHVQVMLRVFNAFGLDSEAETPGRLVLRHGESLVKAMELAARRCGG
jgi:ferritin-like metal-binding protein YciE